MRFIVILITLFAFLIALTVSLETRAGQAVAGKSNGEPQPRVRTPWTSSKVAGSPEPPLPYRAERAFPKIGFHNPVELAFMPGSDRIFVVEQGGTIYSFKNAGDAAQRDVVINLPREVRSFADVPKAGGIGTALGLAFHPQFARNRYCYICYVLDPKPGEPPLANGSRVSRFTVSATEPPRCDPASEVVLLDWRGGGHNGCALRFGPDGYLYISTGDSADPAPPDPLGTGQDISDLLSSILRIDVDHTDKGRPYSIPADNPFVDIPRARAEVWAYGLRNPWRMSFDRVTGNLWAGDVGWELWEMVYWITRGGNYGWSITEGPQPVHSQAVHGPTPISPPALALPHTEAASITGGYVYHGKRLPELTGHYIFGDWETRRIWASKCDGATLAPYRQIAQTDLRIIAFAEDEVGEQYFADYEGGGIYRLVPNSAIASPAPFPRRLSETGLFRSVADYSPAPGVYPFVINAPQWNDGAVPDWLVAVPGEMSPIIREDKTVFPAGTVLLRTFCLDLKSGDDRARRRVETQMLHFDGTRWNAYTYCWNDEQTDALLVDAAGSEHTYNAIDPAAPGGKRERTWHFSSRAQCFTCHTTWNNFTLAFNEPQLDRELSAGGKSHNQVESFRAIRILPADRGDTSRDWRLVNPYDPTAALDDRARSYLEANCAHCHRSGGGGAALIDLRRELPLEKTRTVDATPLLGGFGIDQPLIVARGMPRRSVLLYRMAKLGSGRMPHIGSAQVDSAGVALMAQWVSELSDRGPAAEAAELRLLQAADDGNHAGAVAAIDAMLTAPNSALSLACALHRGEIPTRIREEAIRRGVASKQDSIRELFEGFLPPEQLAARLGTSIDSAKLLSRRGDADQGRKVFFGSAAEGGLCSRCHRVGDEGNAYGPDLTRIATKHDRAALLENILYPSKVIDPQFATYLLRTKKGQTATGLLVKKTDDEVIIKDVQGKETRFAADQVDRLTTQPISSMPDSLLSGLTEQQAADLLEFLSSRK